MNRFPYGEELGHGGDGRQNIHDDQGVEEHHEVPIHGSQLVRAQIMIEFYDLKGIID